MSKPNTKVSANEEPKAETAAAVASTVPTPAAATPTPEASVNFTLTFKRNHPQDRASYGIPGNPGLVVIQRGLFAGAKPLSGTDIHELGGMPEFIVVNVPLAQPKSTNAAAKAEAVATKAAEKAAKAAAKIEKQQAAAAERATKAQAALEAARAKVEAAQKAAQGAIKAAK